LDTKNIAIVGLGQIGCRHLQAILKSKTALNIFAVDPSHQSLDNAKNCLRNTSDNSNIKLVRFEESMRSLPSHIDFAIIATNANTRLQVMKELLTKSEIKYLLLEKVIFQSIDDIEHANKLIQSYGIKCWVNCPRRMWSDYKSLRQFIINKTNVSYRLEGGFWGIGCNSIHFIDHFEWLTNSIPLEMYSNNLDPILRKSKRNGFIEFSGTLEVKYTNNNNLILKSDFSSEDNSFIIFIEGDGFSIKIDESKSMYEIQSTDNNDLVKMKVPYQSELTNIVVDEVFSEGDIRLTPYKQSAVQHKLFLKTLNKHAEKILKKPIDHCEIT
jgi:predicted dehydrogenase